MLEKETTFPKELHILILGYKHQNFTEVIDQLNENLDVKVHHRIETDFNKAKVFLMENPNCTVLFNALNSRPASLRQSNLIYFLQNFATVILADKTTQAFIENDLLNSEVLSTQFICEDSSSMEVKKSIFTSNRHKMLQQSNTELSEHLERNQKLSTIGLLTSGLAHDLNNKLNVVLTSADLAYQAYKRKQPADKYFLKLNRATVQAGKLCQKALNIVKKQEASKAIVNIGDVTHSSLEIIELSVSEKVTIDYENLNHSWMANIDETHMDQILMNLILNSSHAFPDMGIILVKVEEMTLDEPVKTLTGKQIQGEFIRLSIIDNGHGIDEMMSQKIFNPFVTSKSNNLGTGLGMSITLDLVNKNNGYITFTSQKDEGTEFCIYFQKQD